MNRALLTLFAFQCLIILSFTIAAMSETRLPDESQLEEKGAGYTLFGIGKPANDHRQAGVGFAIRTSYLSHIETPPKGISERIMTMRIRLSGKNYATIVRAYTPTMTYPDEEKERFYESLKATIGRVPRSDKLIVLGDFNARVGQNHETWCERMVNLPYGTATWWTSGIDYLTKLPGSPSGSHDVR